MPYTMYMYMYVEFSWWIYFRVFCELACIREIKNHDILLATGLRTRHAMLFMKILRSQLFHYFTKYIPRKNFNVYGTWWVAIDFCQVYISPACWIQTSTARVAYSSCGGLFGSRKLHYIGVHVHVIKTATKSEVSVPRKHQFYPPSFPLGSDLSLSVPVLCRSHWL